MYKWRCVDDIFFGYCNGEPDWEKPPRKVGELMVEGKIVKEGFDGDGTCKHKHSECEKYLTATQEIK